MKLSNIIFAAAAGAHISNALSIPEISDISVRDAIPDFLDNFSPVESAHDLFKRKGGGGKGGGSSSSGGSSSGSSSSGGSSSGGSSSSGGRPAGSGSSGSSGSSGGSRGTSVSPSYGGGRYYGGGSTTAYGAGSRSPRGISPFLIASPLLIFPGLWLAGAALYAYPYGSPYHFYNRTATNSSNPDGMNQTKPVDCVCQQYNPCGCDDNGNSTFLNEIIGNGSYAALNKSLATVTDYNGTSTIVINGTLPNGSDTSGSTTSGSGTTTTGTGAAAGLKTLEWTGYWVMGATVLFTVYGM